MWVTDIMNHLNRQLCLLRESKHMDFNQFPDYQCLDEGTQGEPAKANRSVPDRIKDYRLMNYVTKDSAVLDLGCNRGYFGIVLSPDILYYVGIESDSKQIAFGIEEATKRKLKNVGLYNQKFNPNKETFDIILCLAFHSYVDMSMFDFANYLMGALQPNGYLFLEGHPKDYRGEPYRYFNPLMTFLTGRLNIIEERYVKDRELKRPFIIFQK